MVRSLALGFGMVTALAVAGSMTPAGQGVLGQRHPTENAVQVSSIQDKAAAVPAPAPARVAASTPTVPPAPRRPQAAPAAARPPVTGVPRASQPPQAGQAQGGLGGIAGIANILLNLPHVLDQNHAASGSPPDQGRAKAHKWRQGRGGDDKEPSDNH